MCTFQLETGFSMIKFFRFPIVETVTLFTTGIIELPEMNIFMTGNAFGFE
jgi:hypothetical protein